MLPQPRTAAGAAALDRLTRSPRGGLLALDYDGTLAPIAAVPGEARPAPGAVGALVRCAATFGTVAILTGRPALGPVELAGLGGVPGLERLVVLGHYGNERWTPGHGVTGPPVHPGIPGARSALAALLAEAPAGVLLEDKGLSLAVHTRACARPEHALAELAPRVARVAVEADLEVQHGRLVVELRPPGALDKGAALRAIVAEARPDAVLMAGDDLVDLPAFEAVAELREAGLAALAVFVENREAPPAVRNRADLVVPDPAALVGLLEALVEEAA